MNDLRDLISVTHSEIESLENKNIFYTQDEKFEKIVIPELNYLTNNKRIKKVKEAIFDFQIKNADEYVYEKIVID